MAQAPARGRRRSPSRLGLPVRLRDERLTSFVAEQRVGPMQRGRSGGAPSRAQRDAYRGRIDREAAGVILQDELDARPRRRGERPERPRARGSRSARPRRRSGAPIAYQRTGRYGRGPGNQRRYERYGDSATAACAGWSASSCSCSSSPGWCSWSWRPSPGRCCARSSSPGRGATPASLRIDFVPDLVARTSAPR